MGGQTIDARRVLIEAVHREQSAHELYALLADTIPNREGAKTFAALAKDEADHRRLLEAWWRQRYADPFPFDSALVASREVTVDNRTGALEALAIALEYEEKSARSYEALAAATDNSELRRLCTDIAAQEWGHFETLEAEINALTGDFYWYDVGRAGHVED